jgi:hypothetical protein
MDCFWVGGEGRIHHPHNIGHSFLKCLLANFCHDLSEAWGHPTALCSPPLINSWTVIYWEREDSSTSMAKLASTYMHQGRLREAEELEIQVLDKNLKVLDAKHPDTLTSIRILAFIRKRQGRVVWAIELMRECLRTQTMVLVADHPYNVFSSAAIVRWENCDWRCCPKLRGFRIYHSAVLAQYYDGQTA